MEQIKAHYRCRNCMWAHFMPENMQTRTCRGRPPQILMMPVKTPSGGMGMQPQNMWPAVSVDHPICGAFRRSEATIAAEQETKPLDTLKAVVLEPA